MTRPALSSRLSHLVDLESQVAYRLPPPPGKEEFDYLPGTIPVLLSAPHGAATFRNGRLKEEDDYTAGLSRLLAELTGAHVLFSHRQSPTDPNFYRNVPYKHRLQRIVTSSSIQVVLDLHGASPKREFGIAVGTMHGSSLAEFRPLLLETLRKMGLNEQGTRLDRLDIDETFPAAGGLRQETVTRYVWESLGVPAVQIEINGHLRIVERLPLSPRPGSFRGDPKRIEHVIDTLVEVISSFWNAC